MEGMLLAIVVFGGYLLVGWAVLSAVRPLAKEAWEPGGYIGRLLIWPIAVVMTLSGRRGGTSAPGGGH